MSTIITVAEIRGWLANANTGEAITYFRGFLALAMKQGDRSLAETDRRELVRIAEYLWRAAQHGIVDLVQIRHGVQDFAYLAVVRSRRLASPACSEAAAALGSTSTSPSVQGARQLRGRGQRLLEAH